MKFICLGYAEDKKWDNMSASQRDAMVEECFSYDDELRQRGHWLDGGAALEAAGAARTVRWQNGKVVVTDGPYAETKEQLGGIGVLEAKDMDEAVALMSKHPGVRLGGPFEIRPANEEIQARWEARHEGKRSGTKIFVNLPVKNLHKSVEFFTMLGFKFNPKFTDETATCMIVSDDIFVMLLTEAKFKEFTPKAICDAKKSAEVLVCLSCQSKDAVDAMVRQAVAAGGTTYAAPKDYGFMYQHSFQDLDGHAWELVYMDPKTVRQS